jgi:hypothetical protein
MTRRLFLPALALMTAMAGSASAQQSAAGSVVLARSGAVTLRDNLRHLWADHVVWTRLYIISTIAGDGSAPVALTRLMRNQDDIGNAIKTYYGDAAGTKLTSVLKEHITLAGELLAAAKAGDAAKKAEADKKWHANAYEIAAFMAGANPNWSKSAWSAMLDRHLALTTQEAVDRLQKNWTDDQMTFDMIFNQAMDMADTISDGIIKQFPDKFHGMGS